MCDATMRAHRGGRPEPGRSASTLRAAALGCAVLAVAAAAVMPQAVWATAGGGAGTARGASRAARAPQLHVSGNKLVNAQGAQVVLHGVDRSGTEYSCVHGTGIFDGPSDQASVTAMKSWHVNAVRVPMNEACWNAEPYVNPAYAGASYRSAIRSYVRLLNSNGIVAILDLHWTDGVYSGPSAACSSWQAVCQKPMPDAHSIRFWKSVARAFKGNNAVIFDLFNEPYPERATGSGENAGWRCWRNGGSACPRISYPAVGMQALVNAVRSTGAGNVIMLGGLRYANDLTQWLSHEPADPAHNLAASWHSYNFNSCITRSCWAREVAPVASRVPLIAGEIGEGDCATGYITLLMSWLDARAASYLAWTWDAWPGACASGPALITDYLGHPTAYGAGYRSHLRHLAGH
jgi:endoglucanase